MNDPVFSLIKKELARQRRGLELIASENFTSADVIAAMGSCLTNKYAEGYPGRRYYGGCEVVDEVETLAIERLKTLFGAAWANVQPHSGAQANAAVFLACLQPGDTILGFDLSHGGHLSHGSAVNFSGKNYRPTFYGVEQETGRIDMNKVEETALREKPKLIICGASAYSRDWDYARFRQIADRVGALLLADIAHPAGLIAAGLLNNPIPHCHIVTSTTHKTLRGPRGGIVMMGRDFPNPWGRTTKKGEPIKMSSILDSGVFPGMQGGPLEHVIAAKAIAFAENLRPDWKVYAQQVVKNAAAMADEFVQRGYSIFSGGTDNHLMLIDLRSKNVSGKLAEKSLGEADITVNKNMIPFDPTPAMTTSGIRVGSAAITTRGLLEADCRRVVGWIDEVLSRPDDARHHRAVRREVNDFMKNYPLYSKKLEQPEPANHPTISCNIESISTTPPPRPFPVVLMVPLLPREQFKQRPAPMQRSAGPLARRAARKAVAQCIGPSTGEIFFTSGGTEANNTAIKQAVRDLGVRRIIDTATGHTAASTRSTAWPLTGAWKSSTSPSTSAGGLIFQTSKRCWKTARQRPSSASCTLGINEIGTLRDLDRGVSFVESTVPISTPTPCRPSATCRLMFPKPGRF